MQACHACMIVQALIPHLFTSHCLKIQIVVARTIGNNPFSLHAEDLITNYKFRVK